MSEPVSAPLAVVYFDGTSAIARDAVLRIEADGLLVHGDGVRRVVPARRIQWPERTRHGARIAHFSDGGSVQGLDAEKWDAWCDANGLAPGLVVRLQSSWRWVLSGVAVLLAVAIALQQWGIPMLARSVVSVMPQDVDVAIGRSSLESLDQHLLQPSKLPLMEQERLRAAFVRATAAQSAGTVPAWRLEYRQSRIGPNAFALPGGVLVLTDELVELVERDEEVLLGVLAHELGHVRHRHGLRLLVQTTALASVSAIVFSDFSTVLAGAPALLGAAGYSRDAEREADQDAIRFLKAAKISPRVMLRFFDKIAGLHGKGEKGARRQPEAGIGFGLASHPADAERIRLFSDSVPE